MRNANEGRKNPTKDPGRMAMEGGQALVLQVLTAFQRELHLRGGATQWSTDILWPGRQPRMAGPDAYLN